MARFRKNDFFKWAQKIKSVFCFNPHTHEGCDVLSFSRGAFCDVSIHTPTKDVTYQNMIQYFQNLVSIHTPTKDVTWHISGNSFVITVSIHTPTKDVTFCPL